MASSHFRNDTEGSQEPISVTEKWVDMIRMQQQIERRSKLRQESAPATGAVKPIIFQLSTPDRNLQNDMYMYAPTSMPLGLFNRGDLRVPTKSENHRSSAALVFLEQLNSWRRRSNRVALNWVDFSKMVVPDPARVKALYENAPSMTEDQVRSLLTIDAVSIFLYLETALTFYFMPGVREFEDLSKICEKELEHLHSQNFYMDFLFVENQLPLELVRNVFMVATEGFRVVDKTAGTIMDATDGTSKTEKMRISQPLDAASTQMESNTNASGNPALHRLFGRMLAEGISVILRPCGLHSFTSKTFDPERWIELTKCDHLLHCAYMVVCSSSSRTDIRYQRSEKSFSNSEDKEAELNYGVRIPSLSQLRRRGIKVSSSGSGGEPISDSSYFVKRGFVSDTLYLPELEISYHTFATLRNMVILEGRDSEYDQPLISYLLVMRCLLQTEEDIQILRDSSSRWGGGTDARRIIQGFSTIVGGTTSKLVKLRGFNEITYAINELYKKKTTRAFREFYETYLNKPWKIASLLAAFVLLVLTFLQTLYTILGYSK